MTAAMGHLTGLAVRPRLRGRSARVFTVLAVVLPVPTLAALGLSLPLPATVERLAAKLVPFGDSNALEDASRAPAHGSIVLVPGEQAIGQVGSSASGGSRISPLATSAAGHGATRNAALPTPAATEPHGQPSDTTRGGGATPSAPKQSGDTPSPVPTDGGGPPPPPPPGPGPSPPPSPTPVVDTVIGTVTTATSPAADTTKAVVDAAASAATSALGGIKPP